MHLKKIIELIAEQAARETAKRATGDAPGAVFSCYARRRRRSTTGFIGVMASLLQVLARSEVSRYQISN